MKVKNRHERLSGLKKLQVLDFSSNNDDIKESDVVSVLELNDFISLKELYISDNQFRSFGTIYGLRNLKVLNLRSNAFNNNIFSSLKGLSSLESLFLSQNEIKGTVQINELYAPNDLVELDLSDNEIENFNTSKELRHLSRLERLFLDNSPLNANFLQSIGVMTSLKILSLNSVWNQGHPPQPRVV
ncbi:receptor like protein 14 [Forsythia ovata]|uniref:Receptor like protein 14 n=1 Tax=Forsythia ovata TaxID=205694 RepID=A0ABD1RKI8_9LAMI